ncbi:NADP-dependent oxidoreductase [Bordetella sp. N]|uniref:NADP-dependent oxidoreductase n=1 Tax=Bordetella sp. N TaxID=1746199 RepID=UPI000708AE51|nr:NADP-dependent oxidoreductase [Bordetella sp. N]ALM86547.1 alcohol dehydrogenase [Bordetella sp. N]
MQAALIRQYGALADVVIDTLPATAPAADEVQVRIEAASVNPLDVKLISGLLREVFPTTLPYVPGGDFSGVVSALGADVTGLRVGDRVVGRRAPKAGGAFAGYTTAKAAAVVRMPDAMSFEQAAALPSAFGTAHLALFGVGKLRAGQRVLIHAGAGGVGGFATQLAKAAGAHVSATASAGNHGLLRELGADTVIDYRNEDFTQLPAVDLVLDTIGGDTLARSWQVLRDGGTLATLIDFAIAAPAGRHGQFVFFEHATEALQIAVDLFRQDKLQIVIDSLYPLEQIAVALQKTASGRARGKVIVRMGS